MENGAGAPFSKVCGKVREEGVGAQLSIDRQAGALGGSGGVLPVENRGWDQAAVPRSAACRSRWVEARIGLSGTASVVMQRLSEPLRSDRGDGL